MTSHVFWVLDDVRVCLPKSKLYFGYREESGGSGGPNRRVTNHLTRVIWYHLTHMIN